MIQKEKSDVVYEVVQTSRAFEEVMAQLRRLVVQGHLRPGDRLPSERDLAVKLGVGRNTIREAIRGLEMSGVLELHKGAHGGAFLVAPNGETVATAFQDMFQLGSVTPSQLTEARLRFTASIVPVACERCTPQDIAELEKNIGDARKADRAGDYVRRSRINLQFHKILARSTGNPIFVAVMDGLVAVMEHFIDTIGPPRGDKVFESRARFIGFLRDRDPKRATQEMEDYLKSVHEDYLSRLETPAKVRSRRKAQAAS
ncbi:FadR/GntR family transcriptional regulator [Paraburkholderia sediminicola]|uniref:FadR/GntR family transcriptional regulator n=1 Tax=Paraburkholderia sediminicola TaxID=458836 RepID=UPI0038BD5BE7